MFRKKSDYALNKLDPDAIVYRDANGEIIRLTCDDFESEDEFLCWKKWSDANYHADEKRETIDNQHTVPLSVVSETQTALHSEETRAAEAVAKAEQLEKAKRSMSMIRNLLSEKQFRRLWMWRVEGLSEKEIAEAEGIRQQNVSKSIQSALKTICEHSKR